MKVDTILVIELIIVPIIPYISNNFAGDINFKSMKYLILETVYDCDNIIIVYIKIPKGILLEIYL